MCSNSYHYVSPKFIIMNEVMNLNSHDAYTALGYAAGKFKVSVESSQVHTRLATFKKKCSQFGKGQQVAIWFIKSQDNQGQKKLLLLAVGDTLHNAVMVNPEDVELAQISNANIKGVAYKLNKDGSFAEYVPAPK